MLRDTLIAVGVDPKFVDDYCWRAQQGHQHCRALDQELVSAAGAYAQQIGENAHDLGAAALRLLAAMQVARAGKRGTRPCKAGEHATDLAIGTVAAQLAQSWNLNTPDFPLPEEIHISARRHHLYLQGGLVVSDPVATPNGAFVAKLYREPESVVWFAELDSVNPMGRVAKSPAYCGIGVLSPRSVKISAHALFSGRSFWGVEALIVINRRDVCQRYVIDFAFAPFTDNDWTAGPLYQVHNPHHIPFPANSATLIRQGDLLFSATSNPGDIPIATHTPWGLSILPVDKTDPDDSPPTRWLVIDHSDILQVFRPVTISNPGCPDIRLSVGWWFVSKPLYAIDR